jgi:hypothetical protein
MPKLAPPSSITSRSSKGSSSACRILCAASLAASLSSTLVSRIANSSPPSRATRSLWRNNVGESLSDLSQQKVTFVMAERIVDLLETIQVHEHHTKGNLFDRGRRNCLSNAGLKKSAVRQSSQYVMEGRSLVFLPLFAMWRPTRPSNFSTSASGTSPAPGVSRTITEILSGAATDGDEALGRSATARAAAVAAKSPLVEAPRPGRGEGQQLRHSS